MAKDASALAETALSEVKGKQGFGTLRKVAMSTREAAAQYAELNCTSRPTKLGDQEGCRKHAAVIAQAAQDMRDGVNLGLTGR
ncbi:hypothetical protein [Streptomyces sp. NPDC018045]|uniref:hypothetical protein n=1 Tax=Streptomyces sp. NPDC018045 TaxID=3365037 RepID=UPI0037B11C42